MAVKEDKESVPSIIRPCTPYEISTFLKEAYSIEYKSQRIYRDLKDGRLSATMVGKHWRVEVSEANRYALTIVNGDRKRKSTLWK